MVSTMVLPEDLKIAKVLYECCYSCLNRARMELKCDKVDEAEKWVEEFQRCKRDLDRLIEKKNHHDKMSLLAADLKSKGVNVAIIKKLTAGNSEHKSNTNYFSL